MEPEIKIEQQNEAVEVRYATPNEVAVAFEAMWKEHHVALERLG